LVCPVCKGALKWDKEKAELICRLDGLAFQVEDEIPVMMSDKARVMTAEEKLEK